MCWRPSNRKRAARVSSSVASLNNHSACTKQDKLRKELSQSVSGILMFRKGSWPSESKIINLYGLETNYHRTPEIDPNLVRYLEICTMDG